MSKQLNKRLRESLSDEKIAPKNYSKLKKLLPVEERKKITMIQKQERNHYKILKGIRKELKEKK